MKSLTSLSEISTELATADRIIMDLDGTIADTEPLHWEAHRELLHVVHGIELTDDMIRRYIGHPDREIVQMMNSEFGRSIDADEYICARLIIYTALVREAGLQPFPWVADFRAMPAHPAVYLLTSQTKWVVDDLFEYWGLNLMIPRENRVSVADGATTKRDFFADTARKLAEGMSADHVIVFEDSEHTVKTAKEFGFTVVGILHRYNETALKSADYALRG